MAKKNKYNKRKVDDLSYLLIFTYFKFINYDAGELKLIIA